jgi:hypothetical protein
MAHDDRVNSRSQLDCRMRRRIVLSAVAMSAGCASRIAPPIEAVADWRAVHLPGKRETTYTRCEYEGRAAWHAQSSAAASVWRKTVNVAVTPATQAEFSWWVAGTIAGADLRRAEAADSPVRIGFAFDGDVSRLSMRNRMQFQLIETMTGEAPPFALLMYVWDNHAKIDSLLPGNRSDRVQKIVLESGDANLRQWRHYRRSLFGDFERAFGEPPGRLVGLALMTDTDNTGGAVEAWYGDVVLKG